MTQGSGETIVRWSDDPSGLSLEECARRGIEAVAGLVISGDIFGTNNFPDAHFCSCAEMRHVVTGSDVAFDDHIVVSFHAVEIRDGIYPMAGPESVRMIMQPLADGNVSASWDMVEASSLGPFPGNQGLLVDDVGLRSRACRPMALGEIPEQDEGNFAQPCFLFLKDPGAGWQIWRRFSPVGKDGERVVRDGSRKETFTMIYPVLSDHMNWRFRVYDLPGGGIRWEVDSGNRK